MKLGELRAALEEYPDDFEFGLAFYTYNPSEQKHYFNIYNPLAVVASDEHKTVGLFTGTLKDSSIEQVKSVFEDFLKEKNGL